ncbi:MAG: hypothetical protein LBR80_17450 [Deltaproteobacteria bacterium]|nr:hypothetical protein [Deltaproteobacteria bacterium]
MIMLMLALFAILIAVLEPVLSPCRVSRADDGGANRRGAGKGAGSHPHGKDIFLKFLAYTDHPSLMRALNIPSHFIEGSVPLNTEVPILGKSLRRLDCAFLTRDKSILIIEFQATANHRDIIRFLEYAAALAVKYSKEFGRFVPVYVTVVYLGGVKKLPRRSYQVGTPLLDGHLQLTINQIRLADLLDMAKVVEEASSEIEGWVPDAGDGSLPPWFTRLLLSVFGRVPDDPGPTVKKYLGLGHDMSKKTGNSRILLYMLHAVTARDDIADPGVIEQFLEVLETMGYDNFQIADTLSHGTLSKFQEEVKSLKGALKSRDGTVKSLKGTVKSRDAEIAGLKNAAVMAMHAENKSPEEIGSKLKLKMSEVYRILESNGEDA